MYKTTNISDAEYKAHQEKVKTFQTAIDLVTLAQRCVLFDWSVSVGWNGKYVRAEIENGYKTKIQEILTRHGISVEWEKDGFGKTDVFKLPTAIAEQHPLLVSMRAVKMEAGETSPTNLVMQLAQYMPQNQK